MPPPPPGLFLSDFLGFVCWILMVSMRKLDMGFVCFDRYGIGFSLDELKSSTFRRSIWAGYNRSLTSLWKFESSYTYLCIMKLSMVVSAISIGFGFSNLFGYSFCSWIRSLSHYMCLVYPVCFRWVISYEVIRWFIADGFSLGIEAWICGGIIFVSDSVFFLFSRHVCCFNWCIDTEFSNWDSSPF